MLRSNKSLLLIGTLYWVGLGVLVGGIVAGLSLDNPAIQGVSVAAALATWVIGALIGVQGRDRYGKYGRSGWDRGI
jgi:hypothetical protein